MLVPRRVRGLIGIAVVWGAAISVVGTAFIAGALAAGLIPTVPGVGPARWVMIIANVAMRDFVAGGVAGALFATLLASAERRRTLDDLSLLRVSCWGFLAAAVPTALLPVISGVRLPVPTIAAATIASGLLGVGLSVGMIRLARRGGAALPDESAASVV
jgi:hypothetical protein